MIDEGEDYQENFDAQSDENYSAAEEPWQIQYLHKLLSLQHVEEYTDSELQHILALHGALRKIVQSFYEAYAQLFSKVSTSSK